ncbi:MAG: hypothetical protein QM783_20605 [Phycisphaerales bacterium]
MDKQELLGRPALLIGGDKNGAVWSGAFERVEPIGALRGESKSDRPSFIGIGYTGKWPKGEKGNKP